MMTTNNIVFIINEQTIVHHNELNDQPCSGTLFSALILISQIKNKYTIKVYHNGENAFIDGVQYENNSSLSSLCNENAIAIFVGSANTFIPQYSHNFSLSYYWLHNYERQKDKKELLSSGALTGIICVSKYQLFTMLKSGVFLKSTYINNIFEFNDELNLAFIGALKKEKGLHQLIFLWKKLIDSGYNIKLHIIGSGALYDNKGFTSGLTGIINKNYEDTFISDILDENGNIDNRITFYGLRNKTEIFSIISKCDFLLSGLNEKGAAECFSISSLEAQSVNLTLIRGGQTETLVNSGSRAFVSINGLNKFLVRSLEKKRKLSGNVKLKEWDDLISGKNKKTDIIKKINSIFSGIHVTIAKLLARII